ncbi:hypothetical protein [Methylobacterium sp. WL116]|uniref:hypothetical protein n=1 Tax=Methylobacterium sp. WL116 TaxID=2603889 RepID=UPI0011C9BBDB|nr:hypothetical protein [Methylobacterium sp. WL116]TXM95372.1 hypothetical protein FV223_01060 [Methylobacterium sp. WL116]
MRQAYVGFYWTLPVARRPFRKGTTDVEEAARRSRTIRYQLEVIRRYVREDKGVLVGEAAFVELAADRGTKHIADALAKVVALCATHSATLLYVDFARDLQWRPHPYMMSYLKDHGVEPLPLPADKLTQDDWEFDPRKHFSQWENRQRTEAHAMRMQARQEVQAVLEDLPAQRGRWQAAANELNARGIKTTTGREWTAEGVRRTNDRHGSSD